MRPLLRVWSVCGVLTLALASSCSPRGNAAPGWIVYNDHVSYQGISQDHAAFDLHVAYVRTAAFTDDAQAHSDEALAAFRDVALSLSKPNYDPQELRISRAVSASGVLRITVNGVVKP